jgi:preprotein translocase subunit YajC
MRSSGLIFIVLLLALMWFLLIRPQRRRASAQQQLWQNIQPGDEIVTAGGLYGHVVAIEDDDVQVEIAPGVVVRTARRAVAGIVPPEEPDAEPEEEPSETPAEPPGG